MSYFTSFCFVEALQLLACRLLDLPSCHFLVQISASGVVSTLTSLIQTYLTLHHHPQKENEVTSNVAALLLQVIFLCVTVDENVKDCLMDRMRCILNSSCKLFRTFFFLRKQKLVYCLSFPKATANTFVLVFAFASLPIVTPKKTQKEINTCGNNCLPADCTSHSS